MKIFMLDDDGFVYTGDVEITDRFRYKIPSHRKSICNWKSAKEVVDWLIQSNKYVYKKDLDVLCKYIIKELGDHLAQVGLIEEDYDFITEECA